MAETVPPAVAAENNNTSENPIGTDQDESADVPRHSLNLDNVD